LIWLPVRLVRRSSISNMAFPLGACSFFERASRHRTAYPGKLSRQCRERQAQEDADHICAEAAGRSYRSAQIRTRKPPAGRDGERAAFV
jgi:hypothetical protein